jgi:hypothetical protein
VGPRFRLVNVGKTALHFALLLFTAFWLLATSRPRAPARACFVDLQRRALDITLGARLPISAEAPSCEGIDGLSEGSTLRVSLTRAGEPPLVTSNGCWSYEATELSGPHGVSESEPVAPYVGTQALFESKASFVSAPELSACRGEHHLLVEAMTVIAPGKLVDPLRTDGGQDWRVRRIIRFSPKLDCALLPSVSDGSCQDDFAVKEAAYAP